MKRVFFLFGFFIFFSLFALTPQAKLSTAIKLLDKGNKKEALSKVNDAVMDIENTMSLYIDNLTRAKSINGFGDYVPEHGWVLNAGQDLNLYFEVYGYHVAKKNDKYLLWISEDVIITNPKGEKIFERKNWVSIKQVFPYPLCPVYIINTITQIPAGVYNYKIILHDNIAEKDFVKTIKIMVK